MSTIFLRGKSDFSAVTQKKICMLGDFSVGKTSLVRRFVEEKFSDKYLSTIGAKINRKNVLIETDDQSVKIAMLIWDLAGGEKFDQIMNSYYRGAAGAILVCDLTRPETLKALPRYANDFWSVNSHKPLLVVGNKLDLIEEQPGLAIDDLAGVAEQCQAPYFMSSAKTGENVEAMFVALAQRLLRVK